MVTTSLRVYLIFTVLCLGHNLCAQNGPVDFEEGSIGANWTWTTFENDSNPALEFVANPDNTGINTSSTVARFTALVSGQPFAGCESMHGADVGTFTLDSENAIVKMKVYKSQISNVGFKFATPAGASTGEILVANTLINEWEELVFDFTPVLNEPSSSGIDQIIIFPDFTNRSETTINYFDEIIFGNQTLGFETESNFKKVDAYPNPVEDILSIESDEMIQSIDLYDIAGKLIYELKGNTNLLNVDLSDLKTGVYFLTTYRETGTVRTKIIKD